MQTSLNISGSPRISFYPAWCKRCGNCISFCPRGALAGDEWGYPHMLEADRCTGCGLCEMLCPDFAISVTAGEDAPGIDSPGMGSTAVAPQSSSPERLAFLPSLLEE